MYGARFSQGDGSRGSPAKKKKLHLTTLTTLSSYIGILKIDIEEESIKKGIYKRSCVASVVAS